MLRDCTGERRREAVELDRYRGTKMNPYHRLGAMVTVSTVVMFGMMYLNTYELDHVFFSETRLYMAVLMGAVMAMVMIAVGSALKFAASLWLFRSQATVDDVSYMKAMIPHHSIAILTSRSAGIEDPRVRKLADGIINAQVREIAEMKQLIKDLDGR